MREKKGWRREGSFVRGRGGGMSHGLERGMQRRRKRGKSGGRNEIADVTSGAGRLKSTCSRNPASLAKAIMCVCSPQDEMRVGRSLALHADKKWNDTKCVRRNELANKGAPSIAII